MNEPNQNSYESPHEQSFSNGLTEDEKLMAFLCHLVTLANNFTALLGTVACLILWIVKKDESKFIDYHGRQALNFQITVMIAFLISAVLICFYIGILLVMALWIINLVFTILAALKAKEGEYYEYPFAIKFL